MPRLLKQFQDWMRRPMAYPLGRRTRARLLIDARGQGGLRLLGKACPHCVV